jgi:hypothetical protein
MTTTQNPEAIIFATYCGNIHIESGAARLVDFYGRHMGFIDLTTPLVLADHGDYVARCHRAVGGDFNVSMSEFAAAVLSNALQVEMEV